jgi:glycosyltransferase involved in cell wall biosynthesis
MYKKKITFSIIIPHKNTPDSLERCLNSIPKKEDIQIIIVDDNSDENIVDFNNFPGLFDKYVEVHFTKENKGAGYARNVALSHANGRWLLFADADDFFTENAFEYLFLETDSSHEIIYFRVTSCYSDTYMNSNRADRFNQLISNFISKTNDSENLIRYKHFPPWGKMIKTELIRKNKITFDEVIAENDVMFSLLSGHFASSIIAIDKTIYCYTVTKGSLTNTFTYEVVAARYMVVLRYNKFLNKYNQKKYRRSIMVYLYYSMKFGFNVFFEFFKLMIYYKNNPFIGITKWISNYYYLRKDRKKDREYISLS